MNVLVFFFFSKIFFMLNILQPFHVGALKIYSNSIILSIISHTSKVIFNSMYYLNSLSNANENNFNDTVYDMNLMTLFMPYEFLNKSLACLLITLTI